MDVEVCRKWLARLELRHDDDDWPARALAQFVADLDWPALKSGHERDWRLNALALLEFGAPSRSA